MTNSLNAACNEGLVPSDIHVIEMPGVKDQVDQALAYASRTIEAYGSDEPEIHITAIDDEVEFERDHRYADEVPTDRGDESIVQGYDAYQDDNRKDVLLFRNDRDLVERARSHRVLAHRVEFPEQLPRTVDVFRTAIQNTLYMLAVLFGVVELPKVTLYGVWQGKGGHAWQNETIQIDCRSPKVEPLIERDMEIMSVRK